jgi:hypothetical protein
MFYILISFQGPCRPWLLGLTIGNDIDLNPANKTVPKIDTPKFNKYIYDCSLSRLGTGSPIKCGWVYLFEPKTTYAINKPQIHSIFYTAIVSFFVQVRGYHNLQCYLVMDLIKIKKFWYPIHVDRTERNGNSIKRGCDRGQLVDLINDIISCLDPQKPSGADDISHRMLIAT